MSLSFPGKLTRCFTLYVLRLNQHFSSRINIPFPSPRFCIPSCILHVSNVKADAKSNGGGNNTSNNNNNGTLASFFKKCQTTYFVRKKETEKEKDEEKTHIGNLARTMDIKRLTTDHC